MIKAVPKFDESENDLIVLKKVQKKTIFAFLGVTPQKIVVSLKKAGFRLFFGENPHFHPFRPDIDSPVTYIVGELWISPF